MVFVIVHLRRQVTVVKDWYGCTVPDTKTLMELFHDFAEGIIDRSAPVDCSNRVIARAGKSKADLTLCDASCTVGDVVSFLGAYIEFVIGGNSDMEETENAKAKSDAFSILMSAFSKANHLPAKHGNVVNDKLKLYNDIIDWLRDQNVGFISTNIETLGKKFVSTLTDTLWYIDGNHHTLEKRACSVPLALGDFKGYRCPENKKKRKIDESCLQEAIVRSHSTALLLLSESSFLSREQWTGVQNVVSCLGNNLRKYADYLNSQKIKTAENVSKQTVGEKQKWEVLSQKHQIFPGPLTRYQSLHTAIIHSDEYSPILVNDHAPGEPNRRFDYVKGLVVPAKCVKYTYTGSKEHLVFLWKVPEAASESEILNKNAEISAGLLKTLPKYHTRAMRREFMSLFGKSIHNKAAFLREAYRRLTGDCSASLTADEAEVDKRVTEILENEDSDLIWDLRVNNQGQPEKYLGFLEECQKYISEKVELAVDERRHDKVDSEGDVVTHLAQAFSIRDLHEQVIKSAPPGTRIPSKEWLRFQFWPRNCHFKTAQKYTGKLKIKFMVQSRQFRKNHADMHYASALFRYEKEFAMKYKEHCSFVCMDDKHKVKVGEPGYPVAMVDRGKSVLVAMGKRFEVADHDFTKFSLTPSVNLLVNIPNSIEETFYGGTVYVGFKENCFEPSSPWRHAAELNSVLDLKNDKPILLMYCDGGPDHRLTYASVQMSLITLFLKRNLDMVIAVRTPPGNSWKNPAERIMSILNLGFQSVGIMRQPMPTLESKVNNLSSIGEIRNFADKEPLIREEIKDSMEPVKVLLSNVVHRLQWKGQHLKTFAAASDTAENNLRSAILDVDPDLIDGSTTKNELKGKKQFHSFLSSHCKIRHYMFCVKKCGKATCTLCKPPNLSADVFESLNFLPDPEPDGGDRYKSFDQLYGHETSEKFRPSLDHAPGSGHGMPYAPTAQTAKNVEMVIYCSECEKPRVIYSKHVVRGKKRKELQDVLSDLSYTCGSAFADVETEQDNILKSVHVRRNVSCALPVELAYFSAGFEPVCFHCGQEENLTVFEDKYPICQNCETNGKVCVVKRGRCNKT